MYRNPPPPVSAVIVNHNAGALLADCVAAALDQAKQVVVVDNLSTDDSMSRVFNRYAMEERLNVVSSGRNLGFAAGCNKGGAATTSAYVFFLNPDCVLGSGALARMAEVLAENPQAGMAGGLLVSPDGSEQAGARRAVPTPWRSFVRAAGLTRLSRFCPNLFFDFHLHKQPLPERPIEVEAISGACMLVRREAMEDVGLWDEGYFLHCEDLDWCMRFRQKGWKILFVPDAVVLHDQGACSRARPVFVEWHKHKGMVRFYRKFFRRQYPAVLWALVVSGVWLRFVLVAAGCGIRRLFSGREKAHG